MKPHASLLHFVGNVLVALILALIVFVIVHSLTAWVEYYGTLLIRYPLYVVMLALLFGILSGGFGRSFGFSNMFWHERPASQLMAGVFLALLVAVSAGGSYEILHDLNGDQTFETMRTHRDNAADILWLLPIAGSDYQKSQLAHDYPVDVCEVEQVLGDDVERARNYTRLWFLVWESLDREEPTQSVLGAPGSLADAAEDTARQAIQITIGKAPAQVGRPTPDLLQGFIDNGESLGTLPDLRTRLRLFGEYLEWIGRKYPEVAALCQSQRQEVMQIAELPPMIAKARWDASRRAQMDQLGVIRGRLPWNAGVAQAELEDVAGARTVDWFRAAHPDRFRAASTRAGRHRVQLYLLKAVLPWICLLALPWFWHLLDARLRDAFWRALGIRAQAPEFGFANGSLLIVGLVATFLVIWFTAPMASGPVTFLFLDVLNPLSHKLASMLDPGVGSPLYSMQEMPVLGWLMRFVRLLFTSETGIRPEIWVEIIGVQVVLLAVLLGLAWPVRRARWVSPPVALCWILMIFAIGYALVVHLPIVTGPFVQFAWVLLLLGIILFLNRRPYKLRFPGMETPAGSYYDPGSLVRLVANKPPAIDDPARTKLAPTNTGAGAPGVGPGLLDSEKVLENWQEVARREAKHPGAPILVVVTTTGGSIRAAYWTAKVLSRLETTIPGFPASIRLVTGASGGMLGAALHVALMRNPSDPLAGPANPANEAVRLLPRDSLSDVARSLALNDLPGVLSPRRRSTDRGQALEEAWEHALQRKLRSSPSGNDGQMSSGPVLMRPFRDLAAGEAAGWRPSLVFTPMMAEDGKRLFISNLDLAQLSVNTACTPDTGVFSQSAVEFYRLFPEATGFRLSTAVRMSATFPFVSPAVSLPTAPPRRIVDAGYYDNYGVNTAAMWLEHHKEWIATNTSGVLLVQIRAFAEPNLVEHGQSLANGLSFALTPLKAVAQARRSVMSYRNDELVELLSKWFFGVTGVRDFFRPATFVCSSTASLSWHITKREREDILMSFEPSDSEAAHANFGELNKLAQWWCHRSAEGVPAT